MNIDESDFLLGDSEIAAAVVVVVVVVAVEAVPAPLLNSSSTMLSFVTLVFGLGLIVIVMNRVSLGGGIKSRTLYHFLAPDDTKYMCNSSIHAHTSTPPPP